MATDMFKKTFASVVQDGKAVIHHGSKGQDVLHEAKLVLSALHRQPCICWLTDNDLDFCFVTSICNTHAHIIAQLDTAACFSSCLSAATTIF
jgi:hypothetical protein